MHIISQANLLKDAARYPNLEDIIKGWCRTTRLQKWSNLVDVQKTASTAEAVGNFTVFNLKGNSYRLIVGINYKKQTVYYKYLLTHAEYSKGKWKNDPYF